MPDYTCANCRFYDPLTPDEQRDLLTGVKELEPGEYGQCGLPSFSPGAAMCVLTPANRIACGSLMLKE